MSHDIEAVTVRWQRRNADEVFRISLFAEFRIGDVLPGSIVYDRLRLSIALQRVWHALRSGLRPLARRVA